MLMLQPTGKLFSTDDQVARRRIYRARAHVPAHLDAFNADWINDEQ